MEKGLSLLKPEIEEFLKDLGAFLSRKRKHAGFEQTDVGIMLGKDQSAISRIETGKDDMNVSLLPVFSGLYNFPMSSYFLNISIRESIFKIREAVFIKIEIVKKREQKRENRILSPDKKEPVAEIYLVDGREIREPVVKKKRNKTDIKEFMDHFDGYDVPAFNPLSDEDIASLTDDDKAIIQESSEFLFLIDKLSKMEGKTILTETMIDYVLLEIYRKEANTGNIFAQRMCRYIAELGRALNNNVDDDNYLM